MDDGRPHPATLYLALRDAGMACRLHEGALKVAPVASLVGDLRRQVVAGRQALIDWLARAEEDDARIDALAREAALANPFDEEGPPARLRRSVLLRVSLPGEPPEYAAVDPGWLAVMDDWLAQSRRARREKKRR